MYGVHVRYDTIRRVHSTPPRSLFESSRVESSRVESNRIETNRIETKRNETKGNASNRKFSLFSRFSVHRAKYSPIDSSSYSLSLFLFFFPESNNNSLRTDEIKERRIRWDATKVDDARRNDSFVSLLLRLFFGRAENVSRGQPRPTPTERDRPTDLLSFGDSTLASRREKRVPNNFAYLPLSLSLSLSLPLRAPAKHFSSSYSSHGREESDSKMEKHTICMCAGRERERERERE